LRDGVCRWHARADWCAVSDPDWLEQIMDAEVTDDLHIKQGRSSGRWILQAQGMRLAVYLKRHYRLSWWRGLAASLFPGKNWSPAMQERANLLWAHDQGMCVPGVVAAGEFVGPWGKLQSFLAIDELTDMLPLHQAIPLAARQLAPHVFRVWKMGLTREIARLARFLHDRHAFHKDLYLCHFYILREDTARMPAWTNRIFMIDFHRLARHSLTRTFWLTKDLAQLLFSSELEGIDARDRLRFWRAYLGAARHGWRGRLLRRLILLRGRTYRSHNARLKHETREPAA
jgi:heptose I phosphotransferase